MKRLFFLLLLLVGCAIAATAQTPPTPQNPKDAAWSLANTFLTALATGIVTMAGAAIHRRRSLRKMRKKGLLRDGKEDAYFDDSKSSSQQ